MLLGIVYGILDHMPPFVWAFLNVLYDIASFWTQHMIRCIRPNSRVVYSEATKELEKCSTYEQWREHASTVDEITGANLWRQNFFSRRYDYRSVLDQYRRMMLATEAKDFDALRESFSTTGPCMLRNFAGIVDKKLFTKSLTGTKILIEQYLQHTLRGLELLDNNKTLTAFFQRCKLSLGTTALILQGGSLCGLFHLGVIKALALHHLLPNIISGSSMGACIAAMVGCIPSADLIDLFAGGTLIDMIRKDTQLLKSCGYGNMEQHMNLGTLVQNLVHYGYSQDVYLFAHFVLKYIVGDLTFEEAYQITGKAFNVVINPTDLSCPNLLNYVTTPNVLIKSAIKCSLGSGVIFEEAQLVCKNLDGEITSFLSASKNGKVSFLAPENALTNQNGLESPYTRLTELFNVNNFIISLARPYLAPFIINDLKHEIKTSKYYYYKHFPEDDGQHNLNDSGFPDLNFQEMEPLAFKFKYHLERKVKNIASMEFRHRMEALDSLGLLFPFVKRFIIDEKTPRSATEIAIVPRLNSMSLTRVIEGKLDNIDYWLKCGERSTWPVLSLVKTRCEVEFKINDIIRSRRQQD